MWSVQRVYNWYEVNSIWDWIHIEYLLILTINTGLSVYGSNKLGDDEGST